MSKLALPTIYPITDRVMTGMTHYEQVQALAAGGARLIQLREKSLSARAFIEEARACVKFGKERGLLILINDRVDVALSSGAAGIHLGQDDMEPRDARAVLGSEAIIGYSTHSLAQVADAGELPIDYIAIGPVFPTESKVAPDDVVGVEMVTGVKRLVGSLPLVGIGGIGRDSLGDVIRAGANSVAMISGVLMPPSNIEQNYRELSDLAYGS